MGVFQKVTRRDDTNLMQWRMEIQGFFGNCSFLAPRVSGEWLPLGVRLPPKVGTTDFSK